MGLSSQRSQPCWGKGGRGRESSESLVPLFTLQGARVVRVKPVGAQHVVRKEDIRALLLTHSDLDTWFHF